MPTALTNLSASPIGLGKSREFDNKMKSVKMMLPPVSFGKGSSNLSFSGRLGIMIGKQSREPKLDKKPPRKTRAIHERFTLRVVESVVSAMDEAGRLGHKLLGTEILLLGLIGKGDGMSGKVLNSMEINLEDARVEVEKLIGRGGERAAAAAEEIPWTPGANRVLRRSLEEASRRGHHYVGTGHMLLALLREEEDDGVAVRVLENLGVDPNDIRTQLIGSEEELADGEPCITKFGQHLFSSFMEEI